MTELTSKELVNWFTKYPNTCPYCNETIEDFMLDNKTCKTITLYGYCLCDESGDFGKDGYAWFKVLELSNRVIDVYTEWVS